MKNSSYGVQYYLPGRKRPIAGSTIATRDLINLIAEDHPEATVAAAIELIHYDVDAKAILGCYVTAGYGDALLGDLLACRVPPAGKPRPKRTTAQVGAAAA